MGALDDPAERVAWAVLSTAIGVGPVTFASLVRRFGTATAVLEAARRPGLPDLLRPPPDPEPGAIDILRDPGLPASLASAAETAETLVERLANAGLDLVTAADDAYPERLRAIELAPPVLFVQGSIAALDAHASVAVVGTRRPTEVGRALASRIARELTCAGATVVSGLAVGIDGAAHAATVAEDGPTVAVLGSGHAQLTPRAHRTLAERIIEAGGAVVSEFGPDAPPSRASFPRRNRIVSGLADATVVVEAGLRSGALITARWALEQGRECFLVPGPIGARATAGNLHFLREHPGLARVVADVPELLEDLDLGSAAVRAGDPTQANEGDLGAAERLVLAAVDAGRGSPEELAAWTSLDPASVLGTLTRLELRGSVVCVLGRYRSAGRRDAARPTGRRRPAVMATAFAGADDPVLP